MHEIFVMHCGHGVPAHIIKIVRPNFLDALKSALLQEIFINIDLCGSSYRKTYYAFEELGGYITIIKPVTKILSHL
jgi:hypothetical protein